MSVIGYSDVALSILMTLFHYQVVGNFGRKTLCSRSQIINYIPTSVNRMLSRREALTKATIHQILPR
jgi:hypothetical protein